MACVVDKIKIQIKIEITKVLALKGSDIEVLFGNNTNFNVPDFLLHVLFAPYAILCLRRRQYDFVLGLSTVMYRAFKKLYTLINKAMGIYPNLLIRDRVLLLVSSDCKSGLFNPLDLKSLTNLPTGRSIAYSGGCH